MYAAVRRALQWIHKSPGYVIVPALVFFACEVPNSDEAITATDDSVPLEGSPGWDASSKGVASAPASDRLPDPLAANDPTAGAHAAEAVADPSGACPAGMVLIEGDSCPTPEYTCLEWKDDPSKSQFARCQRYSEPSVCKGERVRQRFCIDKYEAAGPDGLPIANTSWTTASESCKAQGKRLCRENEWVFACEGEQMRPYPYGYVRDPQLCNFEITEGLATRTGDLADHRKPVTANPDCLSPFGVVNMVGNIDEWVELDRPHFSAVNGGRKMMSGLKGGWWGPLRNRCRPTTVDHDEFFRELQTGYRCCSDAL
jgi:formylglycine-generating enzyme